jgi:hypothetical protein
MMKKILFFCVLIIFTIITRAQFTPQLKLPVV